MCLCEILSGDRRRARLKHDTDRRPTECTSQQPEHLHKPLHTPSTSSWARKDRNGFPASGSALRYRRVVECDSFIYMTPCAPLPTLRDARVWAVRRLGVGQNVQVRVAAEKVLTGGNANSPFTLASDFISVTPSNESARMAPCIAERLSRPRKEPVPNCMTAPRASAKGCGPADSFPVPISQ
jgi:hypothetical protein